MALPQSYPPTTTAALPTNPRLWNSQDVWVFFVTEEVFAGMADYVARLKINGPTLLALTSAELRDVLNVKSLGKRKAMLRRIAELEPSRQPRSDTGAASSAEASPPRSDSDSLAPVVCTDDASQEVLFELSVPMRIAPKSRSLVLHVVMLAPPDNRGKIVPKDGPLAGQAVPHVVLAAMDSQGTASCITLAHPDAPKVCGAMQEGESYYAANIMKIESLRLWNFCDMGYIGWSMKFNGWSASRVYPAIRKVNIRLPPAKLITDWDKLCAEEENTIVNVRGVVAHVGELEYNDRSRKVILVEPAAVQMECRRLSAVAVKLWSPRAEVFDVEIVGRTCTMCSLESSAELREYRWYLQLSSTVLTYWKFEGTEKRTIQSTCTYEFVEMNAQSPNELDLCDMDWDV